MEIRDITQVIREHGDDTARKLFRAALIDPEFRNDLADYVNLRLLPEAVSRYSFPPPSRDEVRGVIKIGNVLDTEGKEICEAGLTLEDLNKNIFIAGKTRMGKTNLIMWILDQLYNLNIPFLVFDRKLDYRHLIRKYPITVIPWRKLKFNILRPPETGKGIYDPEKYKQIFADVFCNSFGVLYGSRGFLIAKLDELYREFNIPEEFPTIFDFLEKLEGLKKSRLSFREG